MKSYGKLIFELSKEGRRGFSLPKSDIKNTELETMVPEAMLRVNKLILPEVSESDVIRHYTLLSNKNFGVDTGFYPLGSCTMKYNPKINEDIAVIPGLLGLHPYQAEQTVQGALEIMYHFGNMLSEITGMAKISLQPAAGAHGELAGMMIMKAYHLSRGDIKRSKVIVPDSAHGTNPASAAMAGFSVIEIKSGSDGCIDIESLKEVLNDEIAGLMLTNPSTLGVFEKNIIEIARLIHEAGGLLYFDGANMNAIMGITRPGDMGFDIVHLNLHKTFSAPHGGGGPGSGPIGVVDKLIEFLPVPTVEKNDNAYTLVYDKPNSIGKIKNFYGNFGVVLKAYAYTLSMGADGLKHASQMAVLNANYLKEKLKEAYKLPIDDVCMHEFVLSGLSDAAGVSTLDVAKRLIDYGYHPPTIYFPLIVDSAIMIEPTETESIETLDGFAAAMISIAKEASLTPEILHAAPSTTSVGRMDEVNAAKNPRLKWENY